jgi:hypothetical protein
MYLGVGLVAVMILVVLSPAIWAAWWLLADLGERANETPSRAAARRSTWRAA